jgi:hypothetical protein
MSVKTTSLNFGPMLSHSTVLLLGAGASAPYGYPTGAALRKIIIQGLTDPHSAQLKTTLVRLGFHEAELDAFASNFDASQQFSIDSYLQRQPQFRKVATTAIAATLLPFENSRALLVDSPGRWYQYLFNRLESIGAFFGQGKGRKPLSIITWNYDRSLQAYLYKALFHSYAFRPQETTSELKKLGFLHLHGNLGPLPPFNNNPEMHCYEYGSQIDDRRIRMAAENINIIHDESIEETRFTEAKSLLNSAEQVVIMGTSFHPLNFERLEPREWGSTNESGMFSTVVSTKGIPLSEQGEIISQFNNPCEIKDSDCLAVLHNHKILF